MSEAQYGFLRADVRQPRRGLLPHAGRDRARSGGGRRGRRRSRAAGLRLGLDRRPPDARLRRRASWRAGRPSRSSPAGPAGSSSARSTWPSRSAQPAIAAKMAATLDALSGGRLIFFYDCGWQEAEVRAYGLDWPDEEERIARMDEGLDLIDALWAAEEPLDFRGRYFETDQARCAGRARSSSRARRSGSARRAADAGWTPSCATPTAGTAPRPARPACAKNSPALRRRVHARRPRHRRPGAVAGDPDPARADRRRGAPRRRFRSPRCRLQTRRGRVTDIIAALRSRSTAVATSSTTGWSARPTTSSRRFGDYRDLGISHFMLWFIDFPSLDGLRLFAERVRPAA